jgi:hypothetical protein
MAVKRYNAGIQRAKGLLEIAAALYDTSLSYKTRRAAEGVLQTDSRVGRVLRLSLGVNTTAPENRVPISFVTGNFQEIIAVAQGVYSLAWVNPSVLLTMAYRGKIHSVPHPSDPARRAAIESRSIDAIFDEGIKSWGQTALDNGFRYLPIAGNVLKQMTALGFRRTDMSRCSFHGTKSEVQTLDFSGWPMIVHAGMPNDVAYALCEAIQSRKDLIPTDNYKPLNLRQLCANDDQAPFDVPLHPGARQFYRERGFLK